MPSKWLKTAAAPALVLSLLFIAGAYAFAAVQPDMIILVYGMKNGDDLIGITYKSAIPRAQVNQDLQALQTSTGWIIKDPIITDANGPAHKNTPKMTSVELTVKNAIQPKNNFFTLEPVINALKSHPYMALTYMPYGKYEFQGLRQWHDKYVDIVLDRRGISYTYHIRILDTTFQKLNLPLIQSPEEQTKVAGSVQKHKSGGIKLWQIALVALAAISVSFIVYYTTSRKMQ